MIDSHPLAPQHSMQHLATPAPMQLRQRAQPLPRLLDAIRPGPLMKHASRDSDQPAGATLREMMLRHHFTSATIFRFTWAGAVFCEHVLERPNIERLVSDDPFQPPILFLELAQPAHLGDFQSAVLVAPEVGRSRPRSRGAGTVPSPSQIGDGARSRSGVFSDDCVKSLGFKGKEWSGRPGSNRRRPAWEAGILPLNYTRSGCIITKASRAGQASLQAMRQGSFSAICLNHLLDNLIRAKTARTIDLRDAKNPH